jgi:hypothetical protein
MLLALAPGSAGLWIRHFIRIAKVDSHTLPLHVPRRRGNGVWVLFGARCALGHLQQIVLEPRGMRVPGWLVLGTNAGIAVILSYVISGFLMSMVLAEKYEASRAGTWRFYGARARRIFGLYCRCSSSVSW